MGGGIKNRRVSFIQYKLGGLIRILQNVKAAISLLLDRGIVIEAGGFNKFVNLFGIDLDMNKGNVH